MLEPEIFLERNGQVIKGHTMDLGFWDISQGYSRSVFIRNPNPHAKGVFLGIGNSNLKVTIALPKEVMPLETIEAKIEIEPHEYQGEEEEREFFVDIIDAIAGSIQWRRP